MQRVATLLAGMAFLAEAQQMLEEPEPFEIYDADGDDPYTECTAAATKTW